MTLRKFESDIIAGSGEVVRAPTIDLDRASLSPGDAHVSFRIDSDSHVYTSSSSPTPSIDQGQWVSPGAGVAPKYEVRVTRTGGTQTVFTSGSNNVWESLSSNRTWVLSETTNTIGDIEKNITFTIEIRRASDGVVLSTTTGNDMHVLVTGTG